MITLKINKAFSKHPIGTTIKLDTDGEGNVLDSFWARRLKDSVTDNCVEVVTSNKKTKKEDK